MTKPVPNSPQSPADSTSHWATPIALFFRFALVALLAFGAATAQAQTFDVTLHVNVATGNDSNSGTQSSPLKTINEAMTRAIDNKKVSISTHVLIHPGSYPEEVDVSTYTNFESNQPNNTTPITVEAFDINNRPVITGADVWTGWTQQGNLYVHNWPYNWGTTDAPWQDTIIDLTDIVLRREMVYVDDAQLVPVLNESDLSPGEFFVNESTNEIKVYPPTGVNFPAAKVEVALRARLWNQDYENNITLRGIIFEKSNDEWLDAHAQVRIVGSKNVVIEDTEFRFSNWTGLYIGVGEGLTIRRTQFNDNGGRGMAMWREIGVLVEDSEARRNNWRGFLQGTIPGNDPFTGWTTGGTNIESTHDVTLVRYTADGNFTRGLWLDTDVIDAVFDEISITNSENDGMFLEAVQGPITISNSTFTDNLRHGLFTGMAENVTLDGNTFDRNGTSPIRISGDNNGRGIVNFETGVFQTVLTRFWTMTNNQFLGDGPYLIGTTVNNTRWSEFVGNLTSDFNNWCDETKTNVFQRDGGVHLDFAGWKAHTGEDSNSTFCADDPPPPPGEDENLALNATVSQSSVAYNGVPERAKDGNTDGKYFSTNSTTHTNHDQNAWWEADLGAVYPLTEIIVWNRTDCCQSRLTDFHIFVSDVPFTSKDFATTLAQPGVIDIHHPGQAATTTNFPVGADGRYVRVQLTGKNFLNLAEVEIIGGGSGGGGNQPPTLTLSNRTNIVGDGVDYTIAASDPDGDNLTFTASSVPAGLSFDENAGRFTGTVTSVATTTVNVTVTDGTATTNGSFVWTVSAGGGDPVNVALGAAVDQSSVAYDGVPERAVDGNTNGRYFNSLSVTHTNHDQNAWWEADLGQSYLIDDIVIWNRTDCCQTRLSDFHVFVSDAPFVSHDLATTIGQAGVTNIFHAGAADEQNTFAVGVTGRYVRVQLAGKNFLNMAEVEVYSSTGAQARIADGSPTDVTLQDLAAFSVDAPYPNPFTDRVTVALHSPESTHIRATVFDVTGRRVSTLFDGDVGAGLTQLAWDGRASSGSQVASGVYLVVVETPTERFVAKMLRSAR